MKKSNRNMQLEQLESRELLAATLLPDLAGNTPARARDMGMLTPAVEVTLRDSVQKIGRKRDVDYYKFEITEQQMIKLTLNGLRADADLRLSDADGKRSWASSKAGKTPELIRRELEAGTYYVKVSGWNSARTNYTLRASAEAKPVVIPDPVNNPVDPGTGGQQNTGGQQTSTRQVTSSGVSIELNATGGLKIVGTEGNDRIILNRVSGQIGLEGAARTYAASQVKTIAINAKGGDDVISLESHLVAGQEAIVAAAVVDGHEGNDSIFGGEGDDVLLGGPGNDLIVGNGGNDAVSGALGDDQLIGGFGDDLIDGGDGADTLWGGVGNDTLAGQAGHDGLWGEEDDDRLEGGDGADEIGAGAGNDVILAGGGGDTVYGDEGDDRIHAGGGLDSVWGGAGNDAIMGGEDFDQLIGGDGADTIIGGLGGDSIWGEAGADVLSGDEGNDFLYGGDGSDDMHGGEGADLLQGGYGNDELYGEYGDDSLYGEGGDDEFHDSFLAAWADDNDWVFLGGEPWYSDEFNLLLEAILLSANSYVPQTVMMPEVVVPPPGTSSLPLDPILSGAIFDASGYGGNWQALARDTIKIALNLPNMYRRPLTPS